MCMPETKNTKNINVRVSQELMDKLDAWIKTQPTSPTRGQVVRMALRQLIAEEKGRRGK
jgi:metal-responsive CopG/Arc/MetJ family transcriptional regulator